MTKAKTVKPVKTVRMKAWEPIFQMLMTGEPVKKEMLEDMLGELKYKLSAHILEIKIRSDAVIRVAKDGRKVTSYQLVNPASAGVVKYWSDRGINPNEVKSLEDLNATPVAVEAAVVESETV